MEVRRAMPVIVTDDPAAAREFYESFLGFRSAMDQDGMLMFASRSTPTTQLIVARHSPTAADDIARRAAQLDTLETERHPFRITTTLLR